MSQAPGSLHPSRTSSEVHWRVFSGPAQADAGGWRRAYDEFVLSEPTTSVLWDLRESGLAGLSSGDLQAFAKCLARSWGPQGPAARFAFICSKDVDFGLARMLIAYADAAQCRVTMQVFRDLDAARTWMGQETAAGRRPREAPGEASDGEGLLQRPAQRASSKPPIPGRTMSVRSTSGAGSAGSARASSPLDTAVTR